MNPDSMFGIRHWDLPQILFVGAACFAMAAVGFFIAVFLQMGTSTQGAQQIKEIPIAEKEAAYQMPYERGDGQTTVPISADAASQVYADDPEAELKLKMMQTEYER